MTRTFTILVADGDLARRQEEIRAHFGQARPLWVFRFAPTAREARTILDEITPDAVVLDLALPPGGSEGLDLLQELRHRLPATPVILVCRAGEARLLRDALPVEQAGEAFGPPEIPPDGILFKEDLLAEDALPTLHALLAEGLHRWGRVANDTGILVTHGTDTMAWGFAYLRYALRGLKSNVAMTGSQIPLGGYFTESDALGNLRTAVYLLNRLRPSRLFAVFNNGRSVFSGRLTKFRKWDADAFEGRVIASAESGEVRPLRKDWVYIPYPGQRLSHLHLIRTGGTIESERDDHDPGGLKPTGDFVWKYLTETLGDSFEKASKHDLFALDSSNMSYEEWAGVAKAIEAIGAAEADTRFDPTVKPVFCNPLFTTQDYRAQFAACGAGAIVAGYGGGNANVAKDSPHSILPALRECVAAGTFVAVTSQVPLEPYDAEYETGLALLEAGGVPCGDLPLADAQVKLSYLLGHADTLTQTAAELGLDPQCLLASAFLAGVTMRRKTSLSAFRDAGGRTIPLSVLPYDPFATRSFGQALRTVAAALSRP